MMWIIILNLYSYTYLNCVYYDARFEFIIYIYYWLCNLSCISLPKHSITTQNNYLRCRLRVGAWTIFKDSKWASIKNRHLQGGWSVFLPRMKGNDRGSRPYLPVTSNCRIWVFKSHARWGKTKSSCWWKTTSHTCISRKTVRQALKTYWKKSTISNYWMKIKKYIKVWGTSSRPSHRSTVPSKTRKTNIWKLRKINSISNTDIIFRRRGFRNRGLRKLERSRCKFKISRTSFPINFLMTTTNSTKPIAAKWTQTISFFSSSWVPRRKVISKRNGPTFRNHFN